MRYKVREWTCTTNGNGHFHTSGSSVLKSHIATNVVIMSRNGCTVDYARKKDNLEKHTRLVISPLRRQQSASFHSLAPPLHVLSHFVAKWNTKFNEKIASMPREVPPH
ncbi:hypothetical protein RND81_07G031400 [Saponaria officinalis]|uniref:Uncharacterized protein n=1 Tax=Saponaria officinalis TaxID=3572 RepID=A0AAW1JK52_SAPOF